MGTRLAGTISDTSPASASTATGDTIYGLERFDALQVIAELVGATNGTLDVYLQTSPDGGTSWYDWVHFPQLAAGAAAVKYAFSVPSAGATALTTIGKGTSVALAANTIAYQLWGDRVRAVYVAGASTSAGAAVTIHILGYTSSR
jgi:hypothetical protein